MIKKEQVAHKGENAGLCKNISSKLGEAANLLKEPEEEALRRYLRAAAKAFFYDTHFIPPDIDEGTGNQPANNDQYNHDRNQQ